MKVVPNQWQTTVQVGETCGMLLGRAVELARIDEVLDEARRGRSHALIVRGEAGVGKTALLRHAYDQADGALRLSARGIETESEIAFAGLADLLRPLTDLIQTLPDPQAAALAGALAIGPPVAGDRFTICTACLGVLAAAAETSPVAVVVDDLQWLDPPSTEALLFVARRVEAEGIAMVFSVREGEGGLDTSGLEELVLGGLDEDAARRLLTERTSVRLAPEVARALIKETRGNPLALIELLRVLEPAELSGRRALPAPLPVGPRLEAALVRRIEGLPDPARAALLVAAASDTGAMDEIAAALVALRIPRLALDVAEEAGVAVISDGRLEFGHPLMRSAVYHGASMPERRKAHHALAHAIARPDRRAWQLAAAADTPDESVAQALEEAAAEASARSGYAAAAAALEKAARLTPSEPERARRLLAAAASFHLAGRSAQASELLEEALVFAIDPLLRAEIQHLRGTVLLLSGGPSLAADLLTHEADMIAASAADKAALMLGDAAFAYQLTARVAQSRKAAQQGFEIASRGPVKAMAGIYLAAALVLDGELEEASHLLDGCLPGLDSIEPPAVWQVKAFVSQTSGWMGRYDLAEDLVHDSVVAARLAGAPAPLPYALAVSCEVHYRTGDWTRALADGTEGARLGMETGQEPMAACNLITVGRIYAARGQAEDALATATRATEMTERLGTESLRVYIQSLLGLLEIGLGRGEAAVAHLEKARAAADASGLKNPDVVHFWGDLVEAYLLTGRPTDAWDVTVELERRAKAAGGALALAVAERCCGMLKDEFEAHLQGALRYHETSANPFEKGRTHLAYGERLRRANRRVDARPHLHAARKLFEGLGAAPWIKRAERELKATGERVARSPEAQPVELTPQEFQVALAVAGGATNRAAAASLFLSPKTVEFHLSNVYSKLGLRSRAELAARAARGDISARH